MSPTRPSDDDVLRERARAWIAGDPDPRTRAELQSFVDADDLQALREHVAGTLTFGTAGIRGIVGPGPRRMNRAVVIRTTRGLVDHLDAEGQDGPVVVGFDGRHDSRRFALDTVGVLAAAGREVRWFPQPTPTPLIAYATRRLVAAAGVVITASHNPPQYNGYKVYAANAVQIVPPTDTAIADAIAAVGPAAEVPRAEDPAQARRVEALGEQMVAAYVDDLLAARAAPAADPSSLRIAYTPLHGVGWKTVRRTLHTAGYTDVHVVETQAAPDGDFPTVAFPNPEEPGALDLVTALADAEGADVVLANDPDVDRLGVAVPDEGAWLPLTGNQIGVLLADHVLAHVAVASPLVVSSIVSSPMLGAVADHHGARWEQTLTGFKWICNAALDLERDTGATFVFGYEEALGYTVGRVVRDKDGIGAALAFADLAAGLRVTGQTVRDRLADLYRRDGLWVSIQHSVTRPGTQGREEIAKAMRRLEGARPEVLAGLPVTDVTDYRAGAGERPRWLPATPLVAYDLGHEGRALIRPSGTEPKLKIYVDMRSDLAGGDDPWEVEERLRDRALTVGRALAAFAGLS